jgi:hypothetical protein
VPEQVRKNYAEKVKDICGDYVREPTIQGALEFFLETEYKAAEIPDKNYSKLLFKYFW